LSISTDGGGGASSEGQGVRAGAKDRSGDERPSDG